MCVDLLFTGDLSPLEEKIIALSDGLETMQVREGEGGRGRYVN